MHVNQALSEMFASPKVQAIKNCTKSEKLFLQAVASEITRTGIEEVDFYGVYLQISTLAPLLGISTPLTEGEKSFPHPPNFQPSIFANRRCFFSFFFFRRKCDESMHDTCSEQTFNCRG